MPSKVQGFNVKIGADVTGLQNALRSVNGVLKTLNSEMKYIDNYLKFDPTNVVLYKNKMQDLKTEVAQVSTAIGALETEKRQYERMVELGIELSEKDKEQLRQINIELEAQKIRLKELKAELSVFTQAGRKLQDFGTALKGISSSIENVGRTLTRNVTLPIAAVAAGAVKAAADYETAFTGVRKTVEATEAEYQRLSDQIRQMSKEIPASANEIAGVAEIAGQLGIAKDDIIDFTKVMINLGVSTNLSAEEAASSLAKFANVTKMSSSDYDRLGSAIVDLGNNFATTEADIVEMSTRLAATGELVGLTEPQILALGTAMSSVGIEAEAGGSAMSKLLKKIQIAVETGSDKLEEYASVAGMTAGEFKKLFGQDSVRALSAFIGGLSKMEEQGKSAIVTLDEMGLNEVRLSNTVLALANSHEKLDEAINLSEKAWKENSALTTEAEKRYKTFDSQVQILKNNIVDLAIEIGGMIIPYIQKAINWINKTVKTLKNMSKEEKEQMLHIAKIVALAGPLLTIIGKVGGAIGGTAVTLGKLAVEVAKAKNGIATATTAVGLLAKGVALLTTPLGLATAAVLAAAAAFAVFTIKQKEQINSLGGLTKELKEQQDSWNNVKAATEENLRVNSAETIQLEQLRNKLAQITDENGHVKHGFEEVAQAILNELNGALGTNYKIVDGEIQQYDELNTSVERLIATKKKEAVLSAYHEQYTEALTKQQEAIKELDKLGQQATQTELEWSKARANGNIKRSEELSAEMNVLREKISEQKTLLSEYSYTIENYNNLNALSVTASTEEIVEAIRKMGTSYDELKEQANLSLQEQIESREAYLGRLRGWHTQAISENNEYLATIISSEMEATEQDLNELRRRNTEGSAIIAEGTDEKAGLYAKAGLKLGTSQTEGYNLSINNPETGVEATNQKAISGAAQAATLDTSVTTAWWNLGQNQVTQYEETTVEPTKEVTQQTMDEVVGTMQENEPVVNTEADTVGTGMTTHLDETADGVAPAEDFMNGIIVGLNNRSGSVYEAVAAIGRQMVEALRASLQISSPSKKAMEIAEFFDIGLIKGLESGAPQVENAVRNIGNSMIGNLNAELNDLNGKVINNSKVVFTTPNIEFNVQKMDEENLKSCFNYINEKFGSSY